MKMTSSKEESQLLGSIQAQAVICAHESQRHLNILICLYLTFLRSWQWAEGPAAHSFVGQDTQSWRHWFALYLVGVFVNGVDTPIGLHTKDSVDDSVDLPRIARLVNVCWSARAQASNQAASIGCILNATFGLVVLNDRLDVHRLLGHFGWQGVKFPLLYSFDSRIDHVPGRSWQEHPHGLYACDRTIGLNREGKWDQPCRLSPINRLWEVHRRSPNKAFAIFARKRKKVLWVEDVQFLRSFSIGLSGENEAGAQAKETEE